MFISDGCLWEGGILVIFIFLLFSAFRFKNEYCFYNQKTFSGKKDCNSLGSSMGGWYRKAGPRAGQLLVVR